MLINGFNGNNVVQIDNKRSETSLCGFGVPQGLILGPVLFNLYVSDLSENVTHSKTLQYADDTKIYIHEKPANAEFKANCISDDIQSLRNWSADSNLVFNENKTKTMIFST